MTTNNPTRRGRRGPTAYGSSSNGNGNGNGHFSVGERLRDAREIRGLDLYRVERDTKIRHKYLEALEAGDYADLPGDVYTRGFLRNYATYLGLDPDELVDDWRNESGPAGGQSSLLGAPRPMVLPRRGFFLQTSHMVLVAVILIVAIVGVYFGYQVSRFLSYPTLAVGCPGQTPDPSGGFSVDGTFNSSCYVAGGSMHITAPLLATTYTLNGTATSGSTVSIVWNGQDARTVQADDGGHWTYQAIVVPGQNEFDVTASNIDTNHSSKTVKIFVYVPSPTPTPTVPVVAFASPENGAVVSDGKVTISGTSRFVTDVSLTTTYLGVPPAPGATLSPDLLATPEASPSGDAGASPATSTAPTAPASSGPSVSVPPAPPPASTPVDDKGAFSFALTLDTGVWQLSLTGQDVHGVKSTTVSRVVAVPFTGVVVVLRVSGKEGAWIRYWHDGISIDSSTYPNGWTQTVTGKKNVCVYTGKPSNVYVTVNGVDVGTVSKYGGTHLYLDATHAPKKVASC
jgi:transcriptional regulator with XRE-family HTH domain